MMACIVMTQLIEGDLLVHPTKYARGVARPHIIDATTTAVVAELSRLGFNTYSMAVEEFRQKLMERVKDHDGCQQGVAKYVFAYPEGGRRLAYLVVKNLDGVIVPSKSCIKAVIDAIVANPVVPVSGNTNPMFSYGAGPVTTAAGKHQFVTSMREFLVKNTNPLVNPSDGARAAIDGWSFGDKVKLVNHADIRKPGFGDRLDVVVYACLVTENGLFDDGSTNKLGRYVCCSFMDDLHTRYY